MDSKREKVNETECAKITTVLLKSRTGEFDLESIMFLKLRNLEPLSNCESLQSLNVAGNVIPSVDNLHALKPLKKLESIRLKDNTYNYTNPACKNSLYRTLILEMFPNMKVLDGERVVGRGSDLYQLCKDIDDTIKAGMFKNGHLPELPDTKPWVDDDFWEIKRSDNAIVDEAYKQFSDVLHECRLLNSRAAHVISQNEWTVSLKSHPKQYAV
ncbi:hypothetical protein cypCar_00023789 [Cyprinus carpio]|nr:hypothetical protein cypCar_00023789 [Cyprinus carpio]